MKITYLYFFLLLSIVAQAQTAGLKGQLIDAGGEPVIYANVAVYNAADSLLQKVETTDESGAFQIRGLRMGSYFLSASFLGMADLRKDDISLKDGQMLDLGSLSFQTAAVELATATVTNSRAMVEVKPDRTVFNVDGTINSVGSDALALLRKAPSVTVDNNDNINVLGRAGVLLYVDGKRLPLTGQDLSNYLQNLPADQIDRFDIITNPGAKYEAEGNAGIIDIRLKRDKNMGANGSLSVSPSQGRYNRINTSATGNYRNKTMNAFANVGGSTGGGFNDMRFRSLQNGLILTETNEGVNDWRNINLRAGVDFFLSKNHTLGFLVSDNRGDSESNSINRIGISRQNTPAQIDSLLVAKTIGDNTNSQNTYNLNYRFDNSKGRSLNIDLDYGDYRNTSVRLQPNQYFNAGEDMLLTEIVNSFDTPTDIKIYTAKADYEDEILGGKLGFGAKYSKVVSDNTFLFFDVANGLSLRNDRLSNRFEYNENVYAGYVNYSRSFGKKWNFSAGLRAEQTDAMGNLQAFLPELQAPPVELNYLSWFPSAGLTWQVAQMHSLALNYGRRINRPDYNVLNPFNNQLSQLSYEKGNPFLRPEIVNNLELGYTWKYRYNFKLGYSRTIDQITRLIGPDPVDPRASYISWDNLATQTILSFSASLPVQVSKKWNAYFSLSASHLDNQADYGGDAVVDVQAFTYNIYQQQTFDLPADIKFEVSGWFSGPGVWGGVFEYETSWSLDLGLQRKFLKDRLTLRVGASDIFFESGWDGVSKFNGMVSEGGGRWDSRRVSLSANYRFGNDNVKSRNRKTGLEEEGRRVGSGG